MHLSEFIPSIVYKVKQKLCCNKPTKKRCHPFNLVPVDLEAKWILDVGANIGSVSLAALRTYPNSKVICFEPVKDTFKVLQQNLYLYEDRTLLYNYALSDRTGTADINITTFHGANSLEPQAEFHKFFNPHVRETEKEIIKLFRLDDIAEKFPKNKIDIMKIDVEGHELSVLRGGQEFIKSSVDTIIIEISLMRDKSWEHQEIFDIFALLNSFGFRLINIIDLHHAYNSCMMLTQMDCIFRHKSILLTLA